jgi:PBSX family phage terminase large subunit
MNESVVKISDIILPNFKDFWKASKDNQYLHVVCKGGRNSAKSTHITLNTVLDVMRYPITMLCVRKVERTLEGSVFEQMREAIEMLGVSHKWKVSKSPLKLTYIPRGNSIIFRGADDPAKIKSIKMSKYPIARLWIEEVAEFKTEEEIRTIINSIVRDELPDGLQYKIFYSYNPPKRKNHWVNKLWGERKPQENTFVHYSTYLDNKYISKSAIQEIESLKYRNENMYRWEYLGEPIGNGVVPFSNLTFRQISDNEVENFDNLRAGVDFGYSTDPASYVLWHYDKTRRTLYAVDEIYQTKLSNRELYERIKAKGHADLSIIADSAEPKSVDELRAYGLLVRGAKKGKGSVEYGEKWLDDLDAIIIDPERTPNIAREFEEIDYKIDVYGNTIPKLEEINNHTIDATRYALQDDMRTARANQNVNEPLYDEEGNLTPFGKYKNDLKDIVGSGIDKSFFRSGI